MKVIPLYGKHAAGRVALVDDDDYEVVSAYRWWAFQCGRMTYASADAVWQGKRTRVLMHKLLTGWRLTDHRDRDGLNNQRSNLRPASHHQNQGNRVKASSLATSSYKGVHWDRGRSKWRAQIMDHRQHRHVGYFASEEEAARAYDAAAREAFGEFACPNFPNGEGER